MERFQHTQNQLKKRQKWTFSILIASSIIILFILAPAAAIFSRGFLSMGGLRVLLALVIPNAALITKNFMTSHKLDKLQTEIFATAGILNNLKLKLMSQSSLASQTSETSHTETATNKTQFGSLFTTVTIHQVQETTENLTSPSLFTVPKNDNSLGQSEIESVHSSSLIPK